ncbi:uncharacterized protein LOC110114692 [Dendrobium catenatum]|uniref:uncharacterized protein LOC110114692 n=1 Tax=Dendrobium catenatum TaxID=906689 RepID=UPI0009F399E0|nr:uncharacterized protein LOC110114692 [Dendrobium catenatum]
MAFDPKVFPALPGSSSTPPLGLSYAETAATPSSISEPFPVAFYPPKSKLSFRGGDLTEGSSLWTFSLVGYSLGQRPYYERLLAAMRKVWPLKGAISLLSLADGFFLIKFASQEDYDAVWSGGPWFLLGKPFILQKWSPKFKPKRDENASIPIWIKIVGFPLALWTPTGISKIASYVGIPLSVDSLTAKRSRLTFARVCVLISKESALPEEIPLEIEGEDLTLKVVYDWKPSPCEGCGSLVHPFSLCPKNPNPPSPAILPPRPRGRSTSRPPRPNSRNNSKPPTPTVAPQLPSKPLLSSVDSLVDTPLTHISTPKDIALPLDATPIIVSPTPSTSIVAPEKSIIFPPTFAATNVNNSSPPSSSNLAPQKTIIIPNLNSPNEDSYHDASSSSTDPPLIPSILIGSTPMKLPTSNKFKALLVDDPPIGEDLITLDEENSLKTTSSSKATSPSSTSTKAPNLPPPMPNSQSSPLSKHTRGKSTKKAKPSKSKS